jgi:hypothetical protein
MRYEVIQPPFTLKFREMSKQELGEYAAWLRGIGDLRMSQLEANVSAALGYESWTATFTPQSLEKLGEWFACAVATRARRPDEMAELTLRGDLRLTVPDVDLTNYCFSLAVDVGIYLARTFERAYPQLTWKQFFNDKKFADYGQPVLTGFGQVPLNPVRIGVTLAYGLASGKQTGKRLREIFDYWSNQVEARRH